MKLLARFLGTSVGRKWLLGASGLALAGFLVVHLAGNAFLYKGRDGAAFDAYEQALSGAAWVPLAELALAGLFVFHIGLALVLAQRNAASRPVAYEVRARGRKRTIGSTTMVYTGLLLLGFLVVHLCDFRIGRFFRTDGASLSAQVAERLGSPLGAVIYLGGALVLGLHLSHGVRSTFQSLGASHPNLNPWIVRAAWAFVVLVTLGFASFPVYYLVIGGAR
jgi:succinate dehydrogenase / fumarate reductase cytochrome b subunit